MEICNIEECKGCKGKYFIKGGFCKKNHIKEDKTTRLCIVDGCDNKHYAKGYCSKHYKQFTRYGKTKPEIDYNMFKKCIVDGCNNKQVAKNYCQKHYMQIRRYDKIIK